MIVKGIEYEDFANYKMPSMFIAFPTCSFKCDKEAGCTVCQNSGLASAPCLAVSEDYLVNSYVNNPITSAIVLGGLEPFDSVYDLRLLIWKFRKKTNDPIIIYTGYTEEEVRKLEYIQTGTGCKMNVLDEILDNKNIIIKYGRYIPNMPSRADDILGITLASDNQYALAYNWEVEENA